MIKNAIRRLRSRTGPPCWGSVVAIVGLWAPCGAVAQNVSQGTSTESPTSNVDLQQVVVTATRVERKGFSAPTPTTVIGEEAIAANAPTNIANYLNEIPSFAASVTPATAVASISPGTSGINALNLRALGPNRTLVLLDGRRVAPSSLTDWVDINEIPQELVQRVDVVTGGASADWGSDAVAGVVNFVLDKNFTGVKGTVQAGATTYGDDGNYKASLAAGTGFLNDRGHVVFSVEDAYESGIHGVPRSWYNGSKIFFNPTYTPGSGQPQLLASPDTGFATATPGGIITSGPLTGTYFGTGGTPLQLNYGPVVSGAYMQGGEWQYADFAKSGDLAPQLRRQNIFVHTSYNLTDDLQIFAEGSYSAATSNEAALGQYYLGSITVKGDNAFIPAAVAAEVGAQNIGSFNIGTFNQDIGPIIAATDRSSWRGTVGTNGDFDALSTNWTWTVYGQGTVNHIYTAASNDIITANYLSAIDPVRNSNGAIVCRSTLTDPTNGCVPFDIFGTGVNSQAALSYVTGTAWGRTELTENDVAGNLNGNPFSDWAGPISVAAGIEHRREAVSGSNDPLSPQHAYWAGNYLASYGAYDVTEGYFETVIPLAKDLFLAKGLDFDGAVRATRYSASGFVKTWKIGATYSPIGDLRFRATRSRDIRAPDLAELFQAGQTSTISVIDPFRGNTSPTVFQVTQGNLNLKPEEADTTNIGVVLEPSFAPGLSASVDYYKIKINRAITTVNAPTIIDQCFAGNVALCSQIIRDSSGVISEVLVEPINLSTQIARGVDIETSYRRRLDTMAPPFNGSLTLRLLATHYLENYTNNGINAPTDTVGTNSQNGTTAGVSPSLPNWRYIVSARWDRGPLALTFSARGFSAGVLNTSYIQCTSGCPVSTANNMTINDNHVPGAVYFDANITYNPTDHVETFLTVDNLADRSPVQVASGPGIGGAPLSVNPALYDVLGRTLRLGFRFHL